MFQAFGDYFIKITLEMLFWEEFIFSLGKIFVFLDVYTSLVGFWPSAPLAVCHLFQFSSFPSSGAGS